MSAIIACVQKLSVYTEEEAILLQVAGKGFSKELTHVLGLSLAVLEGIQSRRNLYYFIY